MIKRMDVRSREVVCAWRLGLTNNKLLQFRTFVCGSPTLRFGRSYTLIKRQMTKVYIFLCHQLHFQ